MVIVRERLDLPNSSKESVTEDLFQKHKIKEKKNDYEKKIIDKNY